MCADHAGEVATVSPILHTTACSQIRAAFVFYPLRIRIMRVTCVVSETAELVCSGPPSGHAFVSYALRLRPIDNSCLDALWI